MEVNSPDNPKIDKDEINYLINSVNEYFIKNIKESDIIDTYSGIRPLIEDFKEATKVTRDYIFDLNKENNLPVLLNIYGGKLTTYRKLAEKVLTSLEPYLDISKNKNWKKWTSKKKLC